VVVAVPGALHSHVSSHVMSLEFRRLINTMPAVGYVVFRARATTSARVGLLGFKRTVCPVVSTSLLCTSMSEELSKVNEKRRSKTLKISVHIFLLHMHARRASSISFQYSTGYSAKGDLGGFSP
jgi:hypothetical protein